jgi:hypothetical protein
LNGDIPRVAAAWGPWGILFLFIGGTYFLTSFVLSFRMSLERVSGALGRIAAGEIGGRERREGAGAAAESTVM